jgi:hypothetical protein
MAKINDGTLKDWKDGDKVTSDLYEADREILRVANNDNHDRIVTLEIDKPIQDKRLDDLEYNVTGTVVPMTFKELGMQNLTFDDIKLGYVDQAIAKAWKPSLDTLTRGIVEETTATDGQTVVNLTNSYTQVGGNQITVEIDGVPQDDTSYTETSTTSITLSEALVAGQRVVVTIGKVDPNADARFSSMGDSITGLTTQLADRATKKQSTNWINVAEYVDITGVSDCGTIVNSLISVYTSTDNIVLYFPKGTYNFINNLILKSNMTICGEGTLLLNKAWGIYGFNVTNVSIKDVTIQGIVTDYHVYFKDSNHITIKNVKKYSTSYGFSFMFLHCDYVLVDGNFIKSNSTQVYDDGIHFVGNHIKVINNYVETYDDCVSFGLVNLAESNTVYKDIYIGTKCVVKELTNTNNL